MAITTSPGTSHRILRMNRDLGERQLSSKRKASAYVLAMAPTAPRRFMAHRAPDRLSGAMQGTETTEAIILRPSWLHHLRRAESRYLQSKTGHSRRYGLRSGNRRAKGGSPADLVQRDLSFRLGANRAMRSGRVDYSRPQQAQPGPTIHLPLDHLQPIHLPLDWTVTPLRR